MQTLAFPLRLQENGLLRRQDHTSSMVALLQVMARTSAGSWRACPEFGLRDLFEDQRLREDVVRLAMARINQSFESLGLSDYVVLDIARELSSQRDTDTYAITLGRAGGTETITTLVSWEP